MTSPLTIRVLDSSPAAKYHLPDLDTGENLRIGMSHDETTDAVGQGSLDVAMNWQGKLMSILIITQLS